MGDLPLASGQYETLSGRVGPALVAHSAHAGLLVLASNGPGGPSLLLLGFILGE
jgi:hypothetical protein